MSPHTNPFNGRALRAPKSEAERLRRHLRAILELAEGRRHYDGSDGYDCFQALGDVRRMCEEALDPKPEKNSSRGTA